MVLRFLYAIQKAAISYKTANIKAIPKIVIIPVTPPNPKVKTIETMAPKKAAPARIMSKNFCNAVTAHIAIAKYKIASNISNPPKNAGVNSFKYSLKIMKWTAAIINKMAIPKFIQPNTDFTILFCLCSSTFS